VHAKFRWDISIHSWDKTTSVFGKRMDAILEFYFQLQFSPNFQYRHVILHQPAKFRQNRTTLGIVMMSCPFSSRWRLAAILDLSWILLDHPRCDIAGLSLILNLVLIWSIVLEIWRFLFFWHFGLKLPISAHFPGHISTKTPKGPSLRGNMSFEPQSVKIDPAVPPGRRIEKKVRTVKKVTKW